MVLGYFYLCRPKLSSNYYCRTYLKQSCEIRKRRQVGFGGENLNWLGSGANRHRFARGFLRGRRSCFLIDNVRRGSNICLHHCTVVLQVGIEIRISDVISLSDVCCRANRFI